MKKNLIIAGVVVLAIIAAGAAAWSYSLSRTPAPMTGIVTTAAESGFEVVDQPGATSLLVTAVRVPRPSWVVVHLNEGGKPGPRVGLQHVPAGTSTEVRMPLDPAADYAGGVLVALHADFGTPDVFDFDMKKFAESPDKPYFIGGKELAKPVRVR